MTDLGTLGGALSGGDGINNTGDIVGFSITTSGARHAFLYSQGALQDLNNLIADDSGWTLTDARSINTFGEIIAVGINLGGETHAISLVPPALRIASIRRLSNGHILVEGVAFPNHSYTIQVSSDLASTFKALGPVTANAGGNFQYEDIDSDNYSQRCYRISLCQPIQNKFIAQK